MKEKAPLFVQIITVILIGIFLFLSGLLIREYLHLRRFHEIESYKALVADMRAKAPLTAQDIGVVQSWMTFKYLTTLFNLPPDYLKTALSISDSHYPNISVGRYAKATNQSQAVFIEDVKNAITQFFSLNNK